MGRQEKNKHGGHRWSLLGLRLLRWFSFGDLQCYGSASLSPTARIHNGSKFWWKPAGSSVSTDRTRCTCKFLFQSVHWGWINPFTPESDQCQNSPAASQEIWHHTVWRTWLFIANSDEKWLYYKFSLHHSCNRFWKVGRIHFLSSGVKGLISWWGHFICSDWLSEIKFYHQFRRCVLSARRGVWAFYPLWVMG